MIRAKSHLIEKLQAGTGKEGVPKPILAKIADLKVKLGRAESNFKISNDVYKDLSKETEDLDHKVHRLKEANKEYKKAIDKLIEQKKMTKEKKKKLSNLKRNLKR